MRMPGLFCEISGHRFEIDVPGEVFSGHRFEIDVPGEVFSGHGFEIDVPGEVFLGHGFEIDVPGGAVSHLRNHFEYAKRPYHIYGIVSYPRNAHP